MKDDIKNERFQKNFPASIIKEWEKIYICKKDSAN